MRRNGSGRAVTPTVTNLKARMIQPNEIIRSHRKTLAISIDCNNRLIVRAPYRCGKERIFAFIQEKENWILRKRAERAGTGIELPSENLHGYQFLLLGERCTVYLTDERKIGYDQRTHAVYLPAKNSRKRLIQWLKENAARILTERTEKLAQIMKTAYKSVTISSARGKWGSCSFDNALRYSYRLLYAPKSVIEYVVVHELAHTRHKNHSALFWAEVAKYVPDWKEKRAWLKRHSALMQIF